MTHLLIKILEAVFAFGIVGSAIVVILTSIEDAREVFSKDDSEGLDERQ